MPDLTGTVTLVTGASGTIGHGIARRFAAAGGAVVVHYHRDRSGAGELAGRIRSAGGAAHVLSADLTGERACHDLVDAAAAWRGRLDNLVNNAGIQPVENLEVLTAESWRAMLDANLTSAFACTQAAARVMRETGGSVTHIASIEATRPAFGHAHYASAKAALVMHARAAALEYGPLGIRVNTVSPGLVDRPGLAADWPEGVERWHRAAPLRRLGEPADVGNACVFLASPMASWITGHDLTVDGGVSAHPAW
ncbi:MAG TPA: SDR family NAD(P)-dependent oxidoreductase [Actinophytocola sp.]|uniref:SDR family NAD(P)-dependent oxidoreductase n=1 Tax=Actinophytocola sp. TaxID=1872138 RepID=UPI002F939DA3